MIFNRAIAAMAFVLFANAAVADGVLKGDAAAGEALSASCAACHGADGNSLAPTFPKLAGLGERYLLKQMKDTMETTLADITATEEEASRPLTRLW